jgi:ribosomal-protein-alanine N-acetyltransferase
LELIPVLEHPEDNIDFINNPLCQDTVYMSIDFYKRVGFTPPWICYYAKEKEELVGCAGFKGKPLNGQVEIAYGTFEKYRNQGIAGKICEALVKLAVFTDPAIRISARTLPENNFSTRVLEKNKFFFVGNVLDPEDGDVWQWEYKSDYENES